MRDPHVFFSLAAAMLFAIFPAAHAQTFNSVPAIPFSDTEPVIRSHTESLKPFTVAGERGVVLGQQDGTFEAWVLPTKLLSHLTIEADVEGYSVPIDVNQQAAEIEVRPDRTTITYSHIAFTVRQIMFSPDDGESGTGPMVLFEFDCLHPTDFTFRFTPELRWMWPERNQGIPGAEWVRHAGGSSGYYVLHADYPNLAAAITIPGAEPGILAPYQERPQVHPVELRLHIDPVRDHGRLFPLLMAVGTNPAAAKAPALGATLANLNAGIATSYLAHAERYKKLLENSTRIETPNKALNEAFRWATVSVEQLRAKVQGTGETALVAGYYASGDSARPGFGWFFGRDALYTLYAVNGYGDFALSKDELNFLMKRQRADGKIMHEYSQTAADIDWQSFPYMYAAADATPLFLLAVEDYLRASGDKAFLSANRDAIEKAWNFEISHAPGPEHGGNGIYDNMQGTGWVESWPLHMPHQEIYLALLDQQASAAMAGLEMLLQSPEKADAAQKRADTVAKTIESEFYDPDKNCYAFSRNADGTLDKASTVFPALAWWSELPAGRSILAHLDGCLQDFAAHTLNTDWGLRDVSNEENFYDGMSYHQGSVWPLFTGWAALAEYRANQPLTGYRMLMENANLTWAQDLGADTELLSGDFYVPFGRSTSHQLWSSAMVITPTLRGLFGISIDAQAKTVSVNPHLPADWKHAEVKNLHVGDKTVDLSFTKTKNETLAWIKPINSGVVLMHNHSKAARDQGMSIPSHPVEIVPAIGRPLPGDRTLAPRILREDYGERKLSLILEGLSGSEVRFPLMLAMPTLNVHAQGAVVQPAATEDTESVPSDGWILLAHFPPGNGWTTTTVTLSW